MTQLGDYTTAFDLHSQLDCPNIGVKLDYSLDLKGLRVLELAELY
jgi:hypothetical protein